MDLRRYLESPIREDLAAKMVFLAGPRQVGKTTVARHLLARSDDGVYLNWDNREDRREIRAARWPAGASLVVLDELHKWRAWKSWIKGEFDKHRGRLRFLVTGSARMDVYRRRCSMTSSPMTTPPAARSSTTSAPSSTRS